MKRFYNAILLFNAIYFGVAQVLNIHPAIIAQDFNTDVTILLDDNKTDQVDIPIPDSTQQLASTNNLDDTSRYTDLSLQETINLALEHNRVLKTYRLSGESAKIRLKQAEYRFVPSAFIRGARTEDRNDDLGYVIKKKSLTSALGFSRALETGGDVSISMNSGSSTTSALVGVTNYSTDIGVSVTQPILRGAGIEVNLVPIKRAKDYAKISFLNVKDNMIELITGIERKYWDLILVYEDYDIQRQALERANQLLQINKSLIDAGRMAAQEIVQAESDIATRELAVYGAENDIISTQMRLEEVLDLGRPVLIRPTTKMEFTPVNIKLKDCLKRAYENRPDWLIYNLYLDIERLDLLVAKNNTKYTLSTFAGISSEATSEMAFWNTMRRAVKFETLSWNVGLSFVFPFNKQVLDNYYKLSYIQFERWKLFVEERHDDIRIQVENAVRDVNFTLKQVGLAKRAKELAQQKIDLEEEKMRVGRSSNFQVISYQRDLINAQNKELRTIADYLKALGELQETMGTTLERWGIEFKDIDD